MKKKFKKYEGFWIPKEMTEDQFKEQMLLNNPDDWFRCAYCKNIYERNQDFTEKDIKKEYNDNFPELEDFPEIKNRRVEICDDCYHKFMKWFNTLSEKEKLEMIKAELENE